MLSYSFSFQRESCENQYSLCSVGSYSQQLVSLPERQETKENASLALIKQNLKTVFVLTQIPTKICLQTRITVQWAVLNATVHFLVKYYIFRIIVAGQAVTQYQVWLVQSGYTVSLPGFPTLLSAEGDFLIIAGSIHVRQKHSTRQHSPREDGTGRRGERWVRWKKTSGIWRSASTGQSGKTDPRVLKNHVCKPVCVWCIYYNSKPLGFVLDCMLPLVGPLRAPMACCSSDTLSLRTTSARADLSSWISSSCIWTLCSREAMRSVTSILLAADALSSEDAVSSR